MNTFQVQMERAHQAKKAREAVATVTESLRVVDSLTRALVEPEDGRQHPDIIETDEALIAAQDLGSRVARLDQVAGISGLPGGAPEFLERVKV
jgi:hypothetical protein